MSIVSKIMSWLRPAGSPEDEAEVERLRDERREGNIGNAGPPGIYAPVLPPEDDRNE